METKKFDAGRRLVCTRLKCSINDFDFYMRGEQLSKAMFYRGLQQMGYVWTGEQWIRMYRLPAWYIRLKGAL